MSLRYLPNPTFINIYLTNECNLNCKHCIDSAGKLPASEKEKELSDDEIIHIIDYYISNGVYSISLSGGEPLLHPSVLKFLHYIRTKSDQIYTILITNGTLLTPKDIACLEKCGVSYVRISVESHLAQINDKIRGEGNFTLILKKLKMLIESKIPRVGIATTVSKLNCNLLNDTVRYFYQEVGIRNITIAPLMPVGRGKEMNELVLSPEEFRQLHHRKIIWNEVYEDLNITMDSPLEALLLEELHEPLTTCAPCSIGSCFLGFKANGDIYACPMRDEVIIGNFRKDDLEDIWINNTLLNRIRNLSCLRGKCQNCSVLKECGGGCRAYTHIVTGDIIEADPFCWKAN